MKVTIHRQDHPVIPIGPLTLSTLDFEINALYSRMQVLRKQREMLESRLKQNKEFYKETEKQFYEKSRLKQKIDKIGSRKHSR